MDQVTASFTSRYRVDIAAIGEGGFGRIDKAFDTDLERPVALKTLDPLFKESPSGSDIERFRREARTLAQLSHPSIPAIYDVRLSPENSEFIIIFEWIEGESLRGVLQSRRVLDVEDAPKIFGPICSALAHAHSKGIIHRDIKSANIILREGISCYVVDFGIALTEGDVARLTRGEPIGSAGYMSPEQERGEDVTATSDVFQLAIILYESLAGSMPPRGEYRSLVLHNASIPPAVDELIQQSLQQDSALRPQTAQEFGDRLIEALKPHRSFASILIDGSLQEICRALNDMSPNDFLSLPPGQRVLVVERLTDIVRVDDARLRPAATGLIAEMVRLSHTLPDGTYGKILPIAFDYGYEKQYGEKWHGNEDIRATLTSVSIECGDQAHSSISREALKLANEERLDARPPWFKRDLRNLLQGLLVNSLCTTELSSELGIAMSKVNELSH
ncbi:serine/threonine-protein kinase [Actinoplanes sp. NPDC051343]|uniref:serine/threonine-protein kinase n=1 Tax=Actinoplanes sp. NPDC051343 TaxID=3363906 RepID=UPI0037A702CC